MSKIIIINTVLSRKVTNGETVFKNSLLLAFDRYSNQNYITKKTYG